MFKYNNKILPPSLFFSLLNSPSSPSLPSYVWCSSSFIISVDLILSNGSTPLFYWGAQNWTQHSRCGLPSSEQRGRIPSLDLLVTLLLMQPRISVAFFTARPCCWHMLNSMPNRIPGAFLSCYFLARPSSAFTGAWVPCRIL